mgnify:CR=1 FL=1
MARSEVAYSVEEALAIADKLGYPVVLRPAYTMGGAGGGLVYNVEELKTVCARGLQASLVGQVLVEESILGWEELELEVVRDAKGNMITEGQSYYLVKKAGDAIKVFFVDKSGNEVELETTNIIYDVLGFEDQRLFEEGYKVGSQEELAMLLQDFES